MPDPPGGRLTQAAESYASLRAGRGPNALLAQAVDLLDGRRGRALDVGAGPLNDAVHLLRSGFAVDAIDTDPHTVELAATLDEPGLRVARADVRTYAVAPEAYALVVAIHVFPFLSRADLRRAVPALAGGLAPGGLLCCTFLGEEDAWAGRRPRMSFLARAEVEALLAPLQEVVFSEQRYGGVDARDEPKRWHVHRCIFRRP